MTDSIMTPERILLIDSLRMVNNMSGLLNRISAEMFRLIEEEGFPEDKLEPLSDLLVRRFGDCSGVGLFIDADRIGMDLPGDLRGEEPSDD